MELLLRQWHNLSDDNQLLFKKAICAGFALYIILLVIHDLFPYVLVIIGFYYLYKYLKVKE